MSVILSYGTKMIEVVLIIGFSLVLLAYWFRYTVLLLLSDESLDSNAAVDGQLSLGTTREILRSPQAELALAHLHRALEKDYRMLRYLMDHAQGLNVRPVERALLILDYRMLRVWFRLKPNRRALDEMAGILHYIACKMGERAAAPLGATR